MWPPGQSSPTVNGVAGGQARLGDWEWLAQPLRHSTRTALHVPYCTQRSVGTYLGASRRSKGSRRFRKKPISGIFVA